MARPKSDTVEFFPHKIGDSRLIRTISKKWGNDGYAIYWRTMEALAKCEGHALRLSTDDELEDHAADCFVDEETLIEVLDFCAKRGRIDAELWNQDRVIWCQKFVDNVADLYKRIRRRSVPEKPLTHNKTPSIDGINSQQNPGSLPGIVEEMPQSIVEDSIVEESTPASRILSAFPTQIEELKMKHPLAKFDDRLEEWSDYVIRQEEDHKSDKALMAWFRGWLRNPVSQELENESRSAQRKKPKSSNDFSKYDTTK